MTFPGKKLCSARSAGHLPRMTKEEVRDLLVYPVVIILDARAEAARAGTGSKIKGGSKKDFF